MNTQNNNQEKVKEKIHCCICNEYIEPNNGWIYGNNAEPVKDGRCCNKCNSEIVIPERIHQYTQTMKFSKPKTWSCGHTEDEHCFADVMFCVRDPKWFENYKKEN